MSTGSIVLVNATGIRSGAENVLVDVAHSLDTAGRDIILVSPPGPLVQVPGVVLLPRQSAPSDLHRNPGAPCDRLEKDVLPLPRCERGEDPHRGSTVGGAGHVVRDGHPVGADHHLRNPGPDGRGGHLGHRDGSP